MNEKQNIFGDQFDWLEWLDKPVEEMTKDELEEASNLAGHWPTCACGQLCKALPRSATFGEPLDNELWELGMIFSNAIDEVLSSFFDDEVDEIRALLKEAKEIFIKIEQRTSELLRQ